MELISDEVHICESVIGDLQFIGVLFFVQVGVYFEAGFGACAGDQVDYDLQRFQWDALPVAGDVTEQAMFDLVPFARAWREMADFDYQARGIRQTLQFQSPESSAWTIAAPAVGSDQQTSGIWKSFAAELFPPAFDRSHCELRCVMTDPDADEPFVVLQIINSVGNCLAQFLLWKVVRLDANGVLRTTQYATGIFQISQYFLFLRIDRDRWFRLLRLLSNPFGNEFKLRIAIGMLFAFDRFSIGLQAVPKRLQQFANFGTAHREILPPKFSGNRPSTLDGPLQRRLWIAASS